MDFKLFDLILLSEHGSGNTFIANYLKLFNGLSIHAIKQDCIPALPNRSARYNALHVGEIYSPAHYHAIIQAIASNEKANVCILTRDPMLQMVSRLNLQIFTFCHELVVSKRHPMRYNAFASAYNRCDFVLKILLGAHCFVSTLFSYRLLPFLKGKNLLIIDTADVMPDRVYSTMDQIQQRFFCSNLNYNKVNINMKSGSVETRMIFHNLPSFNYKKPDKINFSLRPYPAQLASLYQIPEHTFINYRQCDVDWEYDKIEGDIAFIFKPKEGMTPQAIHDMRAKIKKILDSKDGKRRLKRYCRRTSFQAKTVLDLYELLKTSKEEVFQVINSNAELCGAIKSKIFYNATALHELGYDVTRSWSASAELLGGTKIMLTGDNKFDHLHAVINEMKADLLQQKAEIEKVSQEKTELESKLKIFEKEKSELKNQHLTCNLSKKQKIVFRLIKPLVKKWGTTGDFQNFQDSPAFFFSSLKSRRYRIFGKIFFPISELNNQSKKA